MKDFVKSRGVTPPLRHPARHQLAPACVLRAATCVLGIGLCLGFVNAGAQQDVAGEGADAWWEGEPGVTESVQQIMDRAAQEAPGAQFPAPVPRQLKAS